MSDNALFSATARVKAEWIDYNGHMNVGYYLVAFDEVATDGYFDYLGIGVAHLRRENKSTFTLGGNIDFLRECFEGERLRFETRLLDYDHKRLHYFHCMYNLDRDCLAATNECLSMYIDMDTRRGTRFCAELLALFESELRRARQAPPAPGAGRRLEIRR